MAHALSVAKEFVKLSFAGDEPDPLTNLRLQKLLYYAQAWSLVARESALFAEELQAWRYGPVVPSVYRHCSGVGCNTLDHAAFGEAPDLTPDEAALVWAVWDSYKGFSATELANRTHCEPPYRKTWGDRPRDGSGTDPIALGDMEDYFAKVEMPAAIAAFEHARRAAERCALEELATVPAFDDAQLSAAAARHAPPVTWLAGE